MGKILSRAAGMIRGISGPGYKQVILVREDLNMPKGKMAAQVAHAAVECVVATDKSLLELWRKQGMKKIVLKVKDLKELKSYKSIADDNGLIARMITDAGHTVFKEATITCVGIGPDEENKIDAVTGKLEAY